MAEAQVQNVYVLAGCETGTMSFLQIDNSLSDQKCRFYDCRNRWKTFEDCPTVGCAKLTPEIRRAGLSQQLVLTHQRKRLQVGLRIEKTRVPLDHNLSSSDFAGFHGAYASGAAVLFALALSATLNFQFALPAVCSFQNGN